jgi:hypothetical protein
MLRKNLKNFAKENERLKAENEEWKRKERWFATSAPVMA